MVTWTGLITSLLVHPGLPHNQGYLALRIGRTRASVHPESVLPGLPYTQYRCTHGYPTPIIGTPGLPYTHGYRTPNISTRRAAVRLVSVQHGYQTPMATLHPVSVHHGYRKPLATEYRYIQGCHTPSMGTLRPTVHPVLVHSGLPCSHYRYTHGFRTPMATVQPVMVHLGCRTPSIGTPWLLYTQYGYTYGYRTLSVGTPRLPYTQGFCTPGIGTPTANVHPTSVHPGLPVYPVSVHLCCQSLYQTGGGLSQMIAYSHCKKYIS